MLSTVGKQPVDDHPDDGEEEDDEAPEQLVQRRAVGLQDLDCGRLKNVWLAFASQIGM